jgi:hypothetical protein
LVSWSAGISYLRAQKSSPNSPSCFSSSHLESTGVAVMIVMNQGHLWVQNQHEFSRLYLLHLLIRLRLFPFDGADLGE